MANKYVFNALTCQYDIIEEGTEGPAGPQGAEGPQGPAGVGVPAGGISGQVLSKSSNNDFATEWITPSGGGSTQDLQSVLDTGESAYDVSIHLSGIAGLYLHGEDNRVSVFQSDTWTMRGEDTAPIRMGLDITPNEIYMAEGIDETMPSAAARISTVGNNGAQLLLSKGGDGYVLTTPSTYVNAETSGTVGTVLMPDTTGDETMATREWVTANSGGGGGSTLNDVLAAGNTASEKSMTLSGDNLPVSITLARDPRSVVLSDSSLAFANASESDLDGTTDVQSNLISMMNYSGSNEITIRNGPGGEGPSLEMTKGAVPRTITVDSSPTAGELLLPSTSGPEVFATREWVAANSGGGGGSQDLQSVLTAGATASLPFTLTDSLSSTSFYVANIMMENATGEEVVVNPALLKFEHSAGNSVTLQPNSDYPLIVTRNGVTSSLRAPESGVTSSDIRFPQTSFGPETIATQEWVTANSGGGGSTPGLDDVLGVGSGALDKQILLEETGGASESTLSPGALHMNTNGAVGYVSGSEVSVSDDTGAGTALLTGDTGKGYLTLSHLGGQTTLTVDTSDSGGELILPGTASAETLATREWASTSVPTIDRPVTPLMGQMVFDTTLGKPIWFNGGAGWVDATGTGV